jgi:hypothetical protein
MPELSTIYDYMRANASLLGERILQEYPALHQFNEEISPRIEGMLRKPFPAQAIAIMGLAKRWQQARTGMVVAECGTGKTLISLGAVHVHSEGNPFTALAMVPPHLVEKWACEAFLTLPGIRVFLIDDLRNGGDANKSHGVNEVRFRQDRIVREGLHTTLSELLLGKELSSSRKRWRCLCGTPSLFIVGRECAKLGYFWRHAYHIPRSGRYLGCVVNSDTGTPVIADSGRLTTADFEQVKLSETVDSREGKSCRPFHSSLWQADSDKIRRMAPIEFIGRYMPGWFDYESGYSLHTLRQASRRSWRIGQRRPVRVKFLCYEGTMQTACLRLMGKKLLVALPVEGKFAGEGLQTIDEDDDMLSAMARELVQRNGIGETADAVWKALNTEHENLFPTASQSNDDRSSFEVPSGLLSPQPDATGLVEEAIDRLLLAFASKRLQVTPSQLTVLERCAFP